MMIKFIIIFNCKVKNPFSLFKKDSDTFNKYHAHFFPIKTIKKHVKFIYKLSQEGLSAIKIKKKVHKKFEAKLKKVNGSNCVNVKVPILLGMSIESSVI